MFVYLLEICLLLTLSFIELCPDRILGSIEVFLQIVNVYIVFHNAVYLGKLPCTHYSAEFIVFDIL